MENGRENSSHTAMHHFVLRTVIELKVKNYPYDLHLQTLKVASDEENVVLIGFRKMGTGYIDGRQIIG